MAEELAITKIDDEALAKSGKPTWLTAEAWELIRRLKPGEMVDLIPLLDGVETNRRLLNSCGHTIRYGLAKRGLKHIKASFRNGRIFAIYYPEQRDGTG